MKNIHQLLQKTWLTDKESLLYTCCLQYGKASAATLSRMTGIPRPSIYDHASRLIKKWYMTTTSVQGKTMYIAVDPQDVYLFLHEQENSFVEKIASFKEAIPTLQQLKTFVWIVPEIQYYEGKESLEQFFYHIAHAQASYSIFSVDDLLKHVYFDIDELYEKLSNDSIKSARRIVSFSPLAKEYIAKQTNPNIARKMLPAWYPLAAEITLYDWVLLQMSFGETPSILELKHPIYYQAHKTMFDYIRNTLP
jgi:sugar-specific transcriptional regulator TrmB